jgi:hypothetical protein
VTATGTGFHEQAITATLWIDSNHDGYLGSEEYVIADKMDIHGGEFEWTFIVDTNFSIETYNQINAIDDTQLAVPIWNNPAFDYYGSISLDAAEVARGSDLSITFVDYLAGPITDVRIGEVSVNLESNFEVAKTGQKETFRITVPDTAPLGTQKFTVYGAETRYTTVVIIE